MLFEAFWVALIIVLLFVLAGKRPGLPKRTDDGSYELVGVQRTIRVIFGEVELLVKLKPLEPGLYIDRHGRKWRARIKPTPSSKFVGRVVPAN